MSTISKLKRISSEPMDKLAEKIAQKMDEGFFSTPELVCKEIRRMGEVEVLLMIFEKFYMRTSSAASLTVQVVSNGSTQYAILVGNGGGHGIFNFDRGVNEEFAQNLDEVLKAMDFTDC